MRVPQILTVLLLSQLLLLVLFAPSISSAKTKKTNKGSNNNTTNTNNPNLSQFPLTEVKQFIQTTNNRSIYVIALKPFRSCAVIFVHGLMGTSQHWFYQYQQWAPNCSTIMFDMYGHGQSTGYINTKNGDPAVIVKDLISVLEWSKASSYVLVGHNYGGIGIQQYADSAKGLADSKLKALVLVDSFARNPNPYREGGDQAVVQLLASHVYKQSAIQKAVLALIIPYFPHDLPPRSWQILAGSGLITDIAAADQIINTNNTFLKNHFQKPVLIVYGTLDGIANKNNWPEIKAAYKNSEYAKIDKACHSPFLQMPAVFNAALQSFLNKINWTISS